jgi:UDP-galactopyranose mutase
MHAIDIIGAGLSGASFARRLVELLDDVECQVIDANQHIAGNCHTERCKDSGVMQHVYGPHIFHTSDEEVWQFVKTFGEWMPFTLNVKAETGGEIYSLPVNLHTINQVFNKNLKPTEARAFIAEQCIHIEEPANFEEQALATIGEKLYSAFFHGYTVKQWGRDPKEIPASVIKRLPLRFDYNSNYFNDTYQAIPKHGYTKIVAEMLNHPRIKVKLGHKWKRGESAEKRSVFTGPIDAFFDHKFGRLAYRTVYWDLAVKEVPDYQGTALINYPSTEVPFTRVIEHRHFAPWEAPTGKTLVAKEFSKETQPTDVPFYPVRGKADLEILKQYEELAEQTKDISFLGRLGTYKYLDMHIAIKQALVFAGEYAAALRSGIPVPTMPKE